MLVMLMAIAGLEKDITDPGMTPLRPSLLENVQVLLRLVLEVSAGILHAKAIEKSPDFSTEPA
jgi:hypothetical protein